MRGLQVLAHLSLSLSAPIKLNILRPQRCPGQLSSSFHRTPNHNKMDYIPLLPVHLAIFLTFHSFIFSIFCLHTTRISAAIQQWIKLVWKTFKKRVYTMFSPLPLPGWLKTALFLFQSGVESNYPRLAGFKVWFDGWAHLSRCARLFCLSFLSPQCFSSFTYSSVFSLFQFLERLIRKAKPSALLLRSITCISIPFDWISSSLQ